jgi:hypothetical protein
MKEFSISEKFRLEIHWNKSIYDQEGIAKLYGCYLSGPVIKEVAQMNEEDRMKLDFSNQYLVFVPYFYIATLYWKGIRRVSDKIHLDNVLLTNDNLNAVPKLNDNDYIVIDTKDHEDEKHQYSLVYPSYLIRFDGEKYDFRGK